MKSTQGPEIRAADSCGRQCTTRQASLTCYNAATCGNTCVSMVSSQSLSDTNNALDSNLAILRENPLKSNES